MVSVISGAAHSMCMGWLLRVHRGALCGVGELQFVLQQSRRVCACCALRVRALALHVSERYGLCRMLFRVMLGGLFGLLRLLSVELVWVLGVLWSSAKGVHARSMCSRARLMKRCSRLLICETGIAMSLQLGTSAGVGSLRYTV